MPLPMMSAFPQSKEDLEEYLQEQLGFLKASADAFDQGVVSEAKRMASVVRTLVHDTAKSKSLLGQVGRKGMLFLDTARDADPTNILSQALLLSIVVGTRGGQYAAMLDKGVVGEGHWLTFEKWWDKTVFTNLGERPLTRRDIIHLLANKDGGSHVDPTLDAYLARVSRLNAMQAYEVSPDGTKRPLTRPELPAMRQIAHEVLRSLIPEYRKEGPSPPAAGEPVKPGERYSVQLGGPYIDPRKRLIVPHRYAHRVGRNEPCPCGSGMKYKHCCGHS